MAAILCSRRNFLPGVTRIWICYEDSPEHLRHFELLIDASAQILTEILQFKDLTYLGTWWRHQWSNPRSFVKAYLQFNDNMYTKFEDDILVRSSVIMKTVIFSSINGYRETTLRSLCDVIDDVITMNFFFSSTIWDDLFISDVKLKLCLIFSHFQNGRHFEVATIFFTGNDTRIWICYKDSHEHSWHFELLIDALARILTETLQFNDLTYFGTWWRHQWSNPRSFVTAYSQFNKKE